jgi:hypothetical protein
MKASTILFSAAAFFTSALAAPATTRSAPLAFSVQLANDQSGKNANRNVIVNDPAVNFGQLFGDAFGHPVFATSLQAVTPGVGGNNVRCEVNNPYYPYQHWPLNAQNTFIGLDGDANAARVIDVTAFTIKCTL